MKKKIFVISCTILVLILIIFMVINLESIKSRFENPNKIENQVKETPSKDETQITDDEINQEGFEDNEYVYYDFSNICNLTDNSLNNFTWHDSLPIDAIRVNRIYTGTWNEDIKYSIWYKTNLNNDYTMLMDNLTTQNNHEIDFTQASLSSQEYITDFEFRFGTVKSQFKEIVQPRLYCDVLNNLENGYKYVNYIRIFGMTEDKYFESKNSFEIIRDYKEVNAETQPRE